MIRDEELFAMSAVIGQALQASAPSPHEAMAILVIAMGRLLGREGFADIARDEAFASVLNDDTKELFFWGFDEERRQGHRGVPRKENQS
jgi:hypothetical protein